LTINDRLRDLEKRLAPSDKNRRDLEEIRRRLVEAVDRIGVDGNLDDVEGMLDAVREARRRAAARAR
jgi:hypothetical protein